MAESWKTTKVTDMTGEQLMAAVTVSVYRGIAVFALISALIGFIFWVIQISV